MLYSLAAAAAIPRNSHSVVLPCESVLEQLMGHRLAEVVDVVVYGRRRSRWISAGCFAAVPRDALLPRGIQHLLRLGVWGSVQVYF